MKKILFAFPLAALLVGCDPSVEEVAPTAIITAEELTKSIVVTQKSEGNNNIVFSTNPTRYLRVYNAETGAKIAEGTAAAYQDLPPAKTLNFYVETFNEDGQIVKSGNSSVTITNFTDVPAIYTDLFGSDYKVTKFVWNASASDGVMGNGAYLENVGPGWWIISAADISSQAAGWGLPDDGLDGYMMLGPSSIAKSSGDTGTVKITLDVVKPGWDIGTMEFANAFPLCGINCNAGNTPFWTYHILKADDDQLRLCAPEPGSGDWGTAWFWNFKKAN